MNTISIQQPWAWLICSFKGVGTIGPKRIENRSRLKHIKGRYLIHAGKRFDRAGYETLLANMRFTRNFHTSAMNAAAAKLFLNQLPARDKFQMGGIVGWADFPGKFITESKDIWFVGPNGLLIDDAGELSFFACRGALSIFDVDYPYEVAP